MNVGLVGWACTSGNGGMNSDIASLAPWVSHWLIPKHPNMPNHTPYLEKAKTKKVIHCNLSGDLEVVRQFLSEVDALLYVEHPCLKDDVNIVLEAKKMNKLVIGIPMWEWWPERKDWAIQTDILWAVTKFTNRYLKSLSDVLYVHGWQHNWRGRVIGDKWGVNLNDFKFNQRTKAERFVFINGNGGYKLRKASDIVFEAFSKPGAPPLLVYTQQTDRIASIKSKNIELVHKNFPERADVYAEGDVFLFPSYWEGLCHGIYEAQAVGGIVITSEHPPMNECGTPYLCRVEKLLQEDLSGKKIVKAVPATDDLFNLSKSIYQDDIAAASLASRLNIERNFSLANTLDELYKGVLEVY